MGPVCTEYQAWFNVQLCVAAERGDLDSVFLSPLLRPGFSTPVVCQVSFPRQPSAASWLLMLTQKQAQLLLAKVHCETEPLPDFYKS